MDLPLSADRATLFFDAVASFAVLVTSKAGRQRRQRRRFHSPADALAWCLEHRTHFVLFWPSAGQSN